MKSLHDSFLLTKTTIPNMVVKKKYNRSIGLPSIKLTPDGLPRDNHCETYLDPTKNIQSMGIQTAYVTPGPSTPVVVAVNRDPAAPIFAAADYALVGDLFELLPLITERVRGGGE